MHLPNPVIRSHYRNNFIKQYFHDHLMLRSGVATNNVTECDVNNAVESLPALQHSRDICRHVLRVAM
jgi:hypothetical protein